MSQNCEKRFAKFPRVQSYLFKLLLLSKQQSKTARLLICYYKKGKEKQHILTYQKPERAMNLTNQLKPR